MADPATKSCYARAKVSVWTFAKLAAMGSGLVVVGWLASVGRQGCGCCSYACSCSSVLCCGCLSGPALCGMGALAMVLVYNFAAHSQLAEASRVPVRTIGALMTFLGTLTWS